MASLSYSPSFDQLRIIFLKTTNHIDHVCAFCYHCCLLRIRRTLFSNPSTCLLRLRLETKFNTLIREEVKRNFVYLRLEQGEKVWVELWQAVHVVTSVTVVSVSHQYSVCRRDAIPFAYGRSSSRMDCRSGWRRKRSSSIRRNRIRALGNGN